MTEDLTVINVDEFLPYPRSRVWRALVEPERLGEWLMPNDFKPVVGHKFTFTAQPIEATGFSGLVACEVLEVQPEELLRYSWTDGNKPGHLDSVVTWTLRPEGQGTRLFLEHSGFDPDKPAEALAHRIMSSGWASQILPKLAEVLSSTS
jgi:uncharacterized protein YndB with AHSA1/START domain